MAPEFGELQTWWIQPFVCIEVLDLSTVKGIRQFHCEVQLQGECTASNEDADNQQIPCKALL